MRGRQPYIPLVVAMPVAVLMLVLVLVLVAVAVAVLGSMPVTRRRVVGVHRDTAGANAFIAANANTFVVDSSNNSSDKLIFRDILPMAMSVTTVRMFVPVPVPVPVPVMFRGFTLATCAVRMSMIRHGIFFLEKKGKKKRRQKDGRSC